MNKSGKDSTYKLDYHPLVGKKDVALLSKEVALEIEKMIEKKLTTWPEIFGKPLRNQLRNFWSLHIGHYRVTYIIKGKTVMIMEITHRSKAYQQALARLASLLNYF